jgi:uncharacterized coiled-coil protein SlyX
MARRASTQRSGAAKGANAKTSKRARNPARRAGPPQSQTALGEAGYPGATATDRVVKLEEQGAFVEHSVDQLSSEMAEMNKQLAKVLKRVETLERRLSALDAEGSRLDSSNAPPPHSARVSDGETLDGRRSLRSLEELLGGDGK